jgi:serine/threonine protein kinase
MSQDVPDDRTVIRYASPTTVLVRGPVRPPANVFDVATRVAANFDDPTVIAADGPSRSVALPDVALPPGSVLNGRYEVLKTIGRGGFAYVYLCQHVRHGRLNAVKEACPAGCGRAGTTVVASDHAAFARAALMREVSSISRVNHPGVVRLEGVFEQNDTLYFAMDFVEGEPLSSLLGRRGPISDESFLKVSGAVLEAVDQLHANDVMHGDIKPANIVLRPDKSVVLIDFGSSERLSDIDYDTPVYTAGYSAIERYQRQGGLGPWSDVYSCAATFAAALTGLPPPQASDVPDTTSWSDFFSAIDRASSTRQRWRDALAAALVPSVRERTASIGSLSEAMGLRPVSRSRSDALSSADGRSIFVSYSRRDGEIVESCVKALQRRGAGVWIDRQDIAAGSPAWGGDIMRGIRASRIVLVFSSCHSMNSENVTREIYLAEKLRKKIVVALLDETPFGDDVSIFLTPSQHIRVADMDRTAFAGLIVQVLDQVAATLQSTGSDPLTQSAQP